MSNSSSSALLRIALLESFQALCVRLDEFCIAVRHDNSLPSWVSLNDIELREHRDMRLKAIELYRALWYDDAQDGRATLTCPGLVGASALTVSAAQTLNEAKDRFKSAVLALKSLQRTEIIDAMRDLHRRQPDVALAMRRMGAARLNLKQAYRHVPLLDHRPLKVGFTWSKQGRVIQRTSVAEAQRLLEQRVETALIQEELQRLATIPANEILARVRSVCPHLRANIVSNDPEGLGVRRRLMQTPLPILIPLQPAEPLPEFVPIAPELLTNPRLRRTDVRIEDEAFLPSIRAHRYLLQFRVTQP